MLVFVVFAVYFVKLVIHAIIDCCCWCRSSTCAELDQVSVERHL